MADAPKKPSTAATSTSSSTASKPLPTAGVTKLSSGASSASVKSKSFTPAKTSKPAAKKTSKIKKTATQKASNVKLAETTLTKAPSYQPQKPVSSPVANFSPSSFTNPAQMMFAASKQFTSNNPFLASAQPEKFQQATKAAVQNTQQSAENVMKAGASAIQDLMSSSAKEIQKAQSKLAAFGQETVQGYAKSADAAFVHVNDSLSMARDNIDAVIQSSNALASMTTEIATEVFNYLNATMADNIETSKGALNCRTVNDFLDLTSRVFRTNIDNMFNESVRLSEMLFKYSAEVAEPIHERVAETTDKISRTLAA